MKEKGMECVRMGRGVECIQMSISWFLGCRLCEGLNFTDTRRRFL